MLLLNFNQPVVDNQDKTMEDADGSVLKLSKLLADFLSVKVDTVNHFKAYYWYRSLGKTGCLECDETDFHILDKAIDASQLANIVKVPMLLIMRDQKKAQDEMAKQAKEAANAMGAPEAPQAA